VRPNANPGIRVVTRHTFSGYRCELITGSA
jgi:hypothetical protein